MSADCKPSSVLNGHLSTLPVARLLKRRLKAERAVPYASGYLAPGGVYMTDQSPGRRCALTAPFHPYRLLGGISLLHLPWSRLHQPLAGTLPYSARTFLIPDGMRPSICLISLKFCLPDNQPSASLAFHLLSRTDDRQNG